MWRFRTGLSNIRLQRTGRSRCSHPAAEPERWADEVQLQVVEEPIIRGVCANPEPGDVVTVQEPEGAIS
jgi:hypothetical protein